MAFVDLKTEKPTALLAGQVHRHHINTEGLSSFFFSFNQLATQVFESLVVAPEPI